jgi:hypothetical protein
MNSVTNFGIQLLGYFENGRISRFAAGGQGNPFGAAFLPLLRPQAGCLQSAPFVCFGGPQRGQAGTPLRSLLSAPRVPVPRPTCRKLMDWPTLTGAGTRFTYRNATWCHEIDRVYSRRMRIHDPFLFLFHSSAQPNLSHRRHGGHISFLSAIIS